MDYAHLNLEHFFARNDDLDVIRDRADFEIGRAHV